MKTLPMRHAAATSRESILAGGVGEKSDAQHSFCQWLSI